MKIGDTVIHPKYGKGDVVKIMTDKDQVICFLANENRYFTKAGAEFMVQAAATDKGSMGADFDHSKAPTKAAAKTHTCSFCMRSFGKERGMQVHEAQCKNNPQGTQWARGKVKKKCGAQPGNQHARKYEPTEKVPISYAERKGLIDDPVKVYSSSKDQIHRMPEQQDTDTETVSNTGATPQAPQDTKCPKCGFDPDDPKVYAGSPQHPATDPIYYLIMAALSVLLLCGLIAAALGVKLLFA